MRRTWQTEEGPTIIEETRTYSREVAEAILSLSRRQGIGGGGCWSFPAHDGHVFTPLADRPKE